MFNLAKISPSIIAVNYKDDDVLQKSIKLVEKSGAKMLHLDVMDGKFVQNTTFGAEFVTKVRAMTDLLLDCHLMVSEPSNELIKSFVDAGADIITVHYEACSDICKTLKYIKDLNCLAGIAINPETDIKLLDNILNQDIVDIVLIMSVHPGKCGQSYIDGSGEKVAYCNVYHSNVEIEVDGGIDSKIAPVLRQCGADILVSGSAIFNSADPVAEIRTMQGNIIKHKLGGILRRKK